MRRAVIIAVSLLLLVAIIFGVYQCFYHSGIPIKYEDMENKQKYLYDNRYFEGKFKMKIDDYEIKSYDFYNKNGNMYITFYTSLGGEPLEMDKDGFVTIKIDAGKEIKKVIYRCEDKKMTLSVKNKTRDEE